MSFYHIRAKECAEYTTTIYCVAAQKNQQKQSTQSLIPFPFFRQYFFQQQTSKPTRILFKSSETLHWFFYVFFYFQASLMQLVHCSDKNVKSFENLRPED